MMLENRLAETLSLNGEWGIEIAGQRGAIQVPGAWEVQGYPDVEGPAVYRREIDVPQHWNGRRVFLRFGAVSYYVDVCVNGASVGTHEGLWTPFEFDVTAQLRPGAANTLELRVTKPAGDGERFPYRDVLVGFIPYVSTTFGGIWQDVALVAHAAPALADLHVRADALNGEVTLTARIEAFRDVSDGLEAVVSVVDSAGTIVAQQTQALTGANLTASLQVEQPMLWSPSSPALYEVRVALQRDGQTMSETARRIGFRTLHTEGERLLLNGETVFARGVLAWGWNPDTLAPILTDEEIRAEFRRVRALGFNLYKLCLYVPPPRLFEIADEEGMLLWLEMPMWLPRLSDHLRRQARQEYADILARVHHHPSIVIYSLGCELSADMADAALLEALDSMTRGSTAGALVCDNSGSGEAYGGLSRDFADFNDYHFYCDLQYFTPLCDHFRRDWRPARPWIFGEFCDCDDYRDPAALLENGERPWWRDLLGRDGGIHRWAYRDQEQRVAAHALPFTDAQIQAISRQQSFSFRKRILETVRARRDIGGYVVTGLRDTPISTSGVFDDNSHSKFNPVAFRQFNADAVLLLEQGRRRVWRHGGDRPAPFDKFNHEAGSVASFRLVLANAGQPVAAGAAHWQFVNADSGEVYAEGRLPVARESSGYLSELGTIEFQMPATTTPLTCRLAVTLEGQGAALQNDWTMWVYPHAAFANAVLLDPVGTLAEAGLPTAEPNADGFHTDSVLITTMFTPDVERFVRDGGLAVVLQAGEGALPVQPLPFWRESIKLLYAHPALAEFPHQGFADMQFYHLATDTALDTDALRERFGADVVTPVLRRLDARLFHVTEYAAEIRIGAGRMIASTLRFAGGTGDQVQGLAANPAGKWLLACLARSLVRSLAQPQTT